MSRKDKLKMITKQFIVDQMTENEIDLSMNELTTVPVKELVKFSQLDHKLNHTYIIGLIFSGSCSKRNKTGLV